MSGYRFCRTDDVDLLVDAYNRCYAVHFDGEPRMTVEDFRRDTREINLWASSCMVAFANDDPIAVLLSAKRETGSLIHRIGVHPDHQRQGHGRHLLTSLRNKLAILGPPRLEVELPAGALGPRRFFESCDYVDEARYADFVRTEPEPADRPTRGVIPIAVDELLECGAFDPLACRSWHRTGQTLLNRKHQIDGLTIASDMRVEAYVLHRPDLSGGRREIVAIGHAGGETATAFLGIVVRHLAAIHPEPLFVPRVSQQEVSWDLLESWGFRRTEEYVSCAAIAPVPGTA